MNINTNMSSGNLKEIKNEEQINTNPNRAKFINELNKTSLVIKIKEPIIRLKYLENSGNIKRKKFDIFEEDENIIFNKNNNNILV